MSRRCTKKVTVNGEVTLHQRYLYRGYLQIACVDLTRYAHPCLWLTLWDPTQPIATRPLAAIQKDGTWYTYGRDLTKNICELFGPAGYIRTTYTYTPFGTVTATGDVTQPIQWSSEYADEELDLIYYNYRHYNAKDGRWINRDFLDYSYLFCWNYVSGSYDYLGNEPQQPSLIVGKPIPGFPHSGVYAGPGNEKGNCASESMDEEEGFDPTIDEKETLPKEFKDKGCRSVNGANECKKDNPKEKHVIYSIDINKRIGESRMKPGRLLPESYHVIGEDCNNPGTYKTQLGRENVRVKGIKEPIASIVEYFNAINTGNKTKLLIIHMCCPCKKK